jgi:predicted RNA binding protein YcfA (HicA-like mRNA interferase family)
MGEKLPVLKPNEVIALLEKQGFSVSRQKGSHVQLRHPDGRATTVPMHKGRDIAPSLLRQICKDIRMPADVLLGD